MIKMLAALTRHQAELRDRAARVRRHRVRRRDGRVVVKKVLAGSPAEKAGLKVGDVIEGVKATNIDSGKDLARALAKAGVGTKLTVHGEARRQERGTDRRTRKGAVTMKTACKLLLLAGARRPSRPRRSIARRCRRTKKADAKPVVVPFELLQVAAHGGRGEDQRQGAVPPDLRHRRPDEPHQQQARQGSGRARRRTTKPADCRCSAWAAPRRWTRSRSAA